MNRNILATIFVFLATFCAAPQLYSSQAYWADFMKGPEEIEIIVIGQLESIESAEYERSTGREMGGSAIIEIYDCGTVRVDSVLWGEAITDTIAVSWEAGNRMEPKNEDSEFWTSSSRSIPVGEGRI